MKYIHQRLFLVSLIVLIIMIFASDVETFREDIKFYMELEQLEQVEHQYE